MKMGEEDFAVGFVWIDRREMNSLTKVDVVPQTEHYTVREIHVLSP
jgi:hypothetical protein